MGNIQLDKALIVFKIIVLPVVLLPFSIEKFEGFCLVFLLVASAPIFNDLMTLSGMGRGVIVWDFLTTPVLMLKTLCVPWRLPVGPRNMPGNVQERMVLVMVGSLCASTYEPKVALQCLSKSSSRPRTISWGEYFLDTPAATGRLFNQSTAK